MNSAEDDSSPGFDWRSHAAPEEPMAYTPTFRPVLPLPPDADSPRHAQERDVTAERLAEGIADTDEDLLLPQYIANPIPPLVPPPPPDASSGAAQRPKGAKKRKSTSPVSQTNRIGKKKEESAISALSGDGEEIMDEREPTTEPPLPPSPATTAPWPTNEPNTSSTIPEAPAPSGQLFSPAISMESLEDRAAKLPQLKVCLSRVNVNRSSPVSSLDPSAPGHLGSYQDRPPHTSGPSSRRGPSQSELQDPVPGLPNKWRSQEATDGLILAWANNRYCCPHPACSWYSQEARFPTNTTYDGPARRPYKLSPVLSHWYITHMAPGYMVPFHCPGRHVRGKGLCDFITADENLLRDHLWHCDGSPEEKDTEVKRQKAYIEKQIGPFFEPSEGLVLPKDEPEFEPERDYALKLSQTIAEVTNGPVLFPQEEEPPYCPPENLASYIPPMLRTNGDEIQINKFTDNSAPSKSAAGKTKPCPASKKMRLSSDVSADPVPFAQPESLEDPIDYEDDLSEISEAHILPKKRGRGRKRKFVKDTPSNNVTPLPTAESTAKTDDNQDNDSITEKSQYSEPVSLSHYKNGVDESDNLFPPTPRKEDPRPSAESLFDSIAVSSTNTETDKARTKTPEIPDVPSSATEENETPEETPVSEVDTTVPSEPATVETIEPVTETVPKPPPSKPSKKKGKGRGKAKKKVIPIDKTVTKEPDVVIENLPPEKESQPVLAEMIFEDVSLPSENEAPANLDELEQDKSEKPEPGKQDQERADQEKPDKDTSQENLAQEKSVEEKTDQENMTEKEGNETIQEELIPPTIEPPVTQEEPTRPERRSRKSTAPKRSVKITAPPSTTGRRSRRGRSDDVVENIPGVVDNVPDAVEVVPEAESATRPSVISQTVQDADNKSVYSEEDIFRPDEPQATESTTADIPAPETQALNQPNSDIVTVKSTGKTRKGRAQKKKAPPRSKNKRAVNIETPVELEPAPSQPSVPESEQPQPEVEAPSQSSMPDTSDEDLVITEVVITKQPGKRRSNRRGPSVDTLLSTTSSAGVEDAGLSGGTRSRPSRQRTKSQLDNVPAVDIQEPVEDPVPEPIPDLIQESTVEPVQEFVPEPIEEPVVAPEPEQVQEDVAVLPSAEAPPSAKPKTPKRKGKKGKGKRKGPVRRTKVIVNETMDIPSEPVPDEPTVVPEQTSEVVEDVATPLTETSGDDVRPLRSRSPTKVPSRPTRSTRQRNVPEDDTYATDNQETANESSQDTTDQTNSKEQNVPESSETVPEDNLMELDTDPLPIVPAEPLPSVPAKGRKAKGKHVKKGRKGKSGNAKPKVVPEEMAENITEDFSAQRYQSLNESVQSILLGCKTVLGASVTKCTEQSTKEELLTEGVSMLEAVLSCRKSLDETVPDLCKLADKTPETQSDNSKDVQVSTLEQKLADSELRLAEASKQFEKDQAESDSKICSLSQELEAMRVQLAVTTGIQTSVKCIPFQPATSVPSSSSSLSVPLSSDAMVMVPSSSTTGPAKKRRSTRGAPIAIDDTTAPIASTSAESPIVSSSLLGPFADSIQTDEILGKFLKPKQVVGVFDECQIESAMSGVRNLVKMLASIQPIEQLPPSLLAQMKSTSQS